MKLPNPELVLVQSFANVTVALSPTGTPDIEIPRSFWTDADRVTGIASDVEIPRIVDHLRPLSGGQLCHDVG
mgnify:CR=1 FL=1